MLTIRTELSSGHLADSVIFSSEEGYRGPHAYLGNTVILFAFKEMNHSWMDFIVIQYIISSGHDDTTLFNI